jgi:hypothetical protein
MLGSWSAMDGASCDEARIVVLNEGSKAVMMEISRWFISYIIGSECDVVCIQALGGDGV